MLFESIRALSLRIRVPSCSADISSEKKATARGCLACLRRGCDMKGDIRCQSGFAHCRPSGKNDQVRAVKPAHLGVQSGQTSAVSRQAAVALEGDCRLIDRRCRDILEGAQSGACFSGFGKLEQLGLGGFDLGCGRKINIRMAGVADHIIANPDQFAPEMRFIDGQGVVGRLRDADDTVGEFTKIIFDFAGLSFFGGAEKGFQGHRFASWPRSINRIIVEKILP